MTREELYNGMLGIKSEYLRNNAIYFNNLRIGSKTTYDRQREILIAIELYLQIMDYYYNNTDITIEIITEEELEIIVAEATRLIRTFNNTYNER